MMKSRILVGCVLVSMMLVAANALAVLTVKDGSLVVQDETGTPIPESKITITFNGTTHETETDDDGAIPLVLVGDGQTATSDDDDGAVVLTGDGEGRIMYPGGPAGGETFVVKDGALEVPSQGLNTTHKVVIGAAAVGGGIVIAKSGDGNNDTTNTPAPMPSGVNVTSGSSASPTPDSGGQNTSIAGPYSTNTNVTQNVPDHPNLLEALLLLTFVEQGSAASVFGNDSDFIDVHGTAQQTMLTSRTAIVRIVASGSGTYSGFPTRAELEATIDTESGTLTGTYSIGTDGRLPGGLPITWSLNGRRQ